ncbi:hypothetical protein ADK76_23885 [Streptomyces griseoflavus]|uniref:hypothetical protein n=1 Tax=Streptomyces rimosus TaxID=1927 RepID=UPI0004C745D0|nr:hypothetical protein [Streptomyces rimosus]KOG54337.1 hypothetical protein ADK76_23885 [Streptomyces griseoflavus]
MPGIDVSLLEAMNVPGARGAALVDWTCGFALESAGEQALGGPEATAAEAAELARLVTGASMFAEGPVPPVEDLIVTTRSGYHLVRFVDPTAEPSVLLHLWLDRTSGNLALARLRMEGVAGHLALT